MGLRWVGNAQECRIITFERGNNVGFQVYFILNSRELNFEPCLICILLRCENKECRYDNRSCRYDCEGDISRNMH